MNDKYTEPMLDRLYPMTSQSGEQHVEELTDKESHALRKLVWSL
ncbi:hypothetical protein P4S64_03170 [Vibrio sp. M60_M31a]